MCANTRLVQVTSPSTYISVDVVDPSGGQSLRIQCTTALNIFLLFPVARLNFRAAAMGDETRGNLLRIGPSRKQVRKPKDRQRPKVPPLGHQQKPNSKSAVRWDSWSLQPRREQAKQGASRMIFLCQKHSAPDNHWKESDPQGCSGSLFVASAKQIRDLDVWSIL